MASRYEFSYTTPTPSVDGNGQPITIQVPNTFALGGISDIVAKCIRFGLRKGQQLGYIAGVDCQAVDETRTAVTADPS